MSSAGLLFIILTSCLPVSLKAQDMKSTLVSLSLKERPIREAFKAIEQQTGMSINYQDNTIDASTKVSIEVSKMPLTTVMIQLLDGQHAGFQQEGSMIIITARASTQETFGVLKGRVVDFETSQPLPGATATLLETGKSVVADEKGYYVFNHLKDGIYTLIITYSGYEKNILKNIRVSGGRTTVYDVKMAVGKALEEVVVKGGNYRIKTVTHTTDKELIADIRNATGSVSGISAEMINKTADRNAAEVVKKISGVTVVDERFIIVRGMNERYNLTYLNGNVAPSTELYNKAFAYDLLPSSIIDKILVYKSPVANLVGEYGGAAIKVTTKDAVPVKHLDIGIQLAYRPGSSLTTINTYQGGKYDFLGFDDGSRKLPWFSPSYFQSNKQSTGIDQQTMVKAFSPVLDYGTAHSLPDMQLFLNYYNNFKINAHTHLYDLTSVTYTYETRFYNQYKQTGNTYAYPFTSDPGSGLQIGATNQIIHTQQTTEIGKINILENLTLKWNPRNSIHLQNFFINEGRNITTVDDEVPNILPRLDSLTDGNSHIHNINLSFQQRLLYFGNLTGNHSFGKHQRQTRC